MKKRFITFLSGMVVGAVMFGGSVAYASGILADLSNNQIFVDGTLTPMEAYVINGHNYVKLRDIGQSVGFNVFWDDTAKCVQVESDKPSCFVGASPILGLRLQSKRARRQVASSTRLMLMP